MHVFVETGTDAAALAAGDIEAINEVLDAPSLDAWIERRDRAAASGVLWRTDTGSDGSFLVHLFVDEEPRSELVPYLRDPIEIPRFPIPSGRVLVAGEECFARRHIEKIRLGKVVELPENSRSLPTAPSTRTTSLSAVFGRPGLPGKYAPGRSETRSR